MEAILELIYNLTESSAGVKWAPVIFPWFATIMLYVLFAKTVPIISIWELKAGEHPSPKLVPPATEEHRLGELHL